MAFYWQTIARGRTCHIEWTSLKRIDLELLYGQRVHADGSVEPGRRGQEMIAKELPTESKFTVAQIARCRLAIITSTLNDGEEMTHGHFRT